MGTRTRSRYPSPGFDSTMWWDDGRPTEPVIVLATSRHKRKLAPAEALPLLEAMWDEYGATADPATAETITWRSVTEADMDTGLIGEVNPGDWSTEGGGSAWVLILRCDATPRADRGDRA